MSKKALTLKERKEEKRRLQKVEDRYDDPNMEARRFCFSHKFSVYPEIQTGTNRLKVFVQHHDRFLPLSEDTYDQSTLQEVKEMYAKIDAKYEELYEKHRSKGFGSFSS